MPKKLYYTLLMTLMNSIFGMFHLIYMCVIFYINKALITNKCLKWIKSAKNEEKCSVSGSSSSMQLCSVSRSSSCMQLCSATRSSSCMQLCSVSRSSSCMQLCSELIHRVQIIMSSILGLMQWDNLCCYNVEVVTLLNIIWRANNI